MGNLNTQLIELGIHERPKLILGSEHLDVFGPRSYSASPNRLATQFFSLGDEHYNRERFLEFGIEYIVVINTQTESQRYEVQKKWALENFSIVFQNSEGWILRYQ